MSAYSFAQRFQASEKQRGDRLAARLSVWEDTTAGANGITIIASRAGYGSKNLGAVNVFRSAPGTDGTVFVAEQVLQATGSHPFSGFGDSFMLNRYTIAIGAPFERGSGATGCVAGTAQYGLWFRDIQHVLLCLLL